MPHAVIRVNAVNRVPDARRRTGLVPPLEARWRETVERIRTELPPDHPMQSAGSAMRSELALDDLQDQFYTAKAEQQPPPDSPAIREARAEFREFQRQYNAACLEIKAAQPFLRHAATDWKLRLLGLVSPDMFSVPTPVDFSTEFRSVSEARQSVQSMLPRLQFIKGICAQITAARHFEAQSLDERNSDLIGALVARKQDTDARVVKLEAQCTALEARLNRLERGRRKKTKASTVGRTAA
jgi:hypothetical protein